MISDAPVAIIGDVHGEASRLRTALDDLGPSGRRLIFVGDYVNRGKDSRDVIELLVELQARRANSVFLRGNHDDSLIQFLDGRGSDAFIRHGGLVTIASYIKDPALGVLDTFVQQFPSDHYRFLKSTVCYYEAPGLLVSHAGYNPSRPFARDDQTMIHGRHLSLFEGEDDRPQDLVVFGHYVQRTKLPFARNGIICLDTGCGTLDGGPLTALLLPEKAFVQF
jgi:serine/threonine protein phosphatase 1